jgi:hypothetical protein
MNPLRSELASPCLSLEGVVVGSRLLRPFAECEPGVSLGNPSVAHVLRARNPSAILRRVSGLVVNPVNLMLRGRARPHVGKKRFKGLAPSFANSDSTTSIVGVSLDVRVCAPRSHRSPCKPFWRSIHSMCFATGASYVCRKTSARPSHSRFQAKPINDFRVSAYTAAKPSWLFTSVLRSRNNGQTLKGAATQICSFH